MLAIGLTKTGFQHGDAWRTTVTTEEARHPRGTFGTTWRRDELREFRGSPNFFVLKSFRSQKRIRTVPVSDSAVRRMMSRVIARLRPFHPASSRSFAPCRTRTTSPGSTVSFRKQTTVGPASNRTSPQVSGKRKRQPGSLLWCNSVRPSTRAGNESALSHTTRSDRHAPQNSFAGYLVTPQSAQLCNLIMRTPAQRPRSTIRDHS